MSFIKRLFFKEIENMLQEGSLTAASLAAKFEVSEDTAYRRIKEYQEATGIVFDPVARTWKNPNLTKPEGSN